jgi:hypothetical protein
MSKKRNTQPDQIINVGPLPKGAGRQEVNINPPVVRPAEAPSSTQVSSGTPHDAAGTSHLVIVVAVAALLVIIACGVATALTAGAIW